MANIFRLPTSLGVAVAIMVTAGVPARAPGAAPIISASATQPSANAAPLYRQAVDLLDANLKKHPKEIEFDAPIDAKVAQYLTDQKPAIDLLRQAAAMPSCNWPQVYELADTNMLGKLRRLANLGVLQARFDLAQKQPDAAVNDLLAVASLGRHVGQTPLMLAKLVDIGISERSIQQLASALPELPKDIVATLPARLDALPAGSTFGDCIAGEHPYMLELVKNQKFPPGTYDEPSVKLTKPWYDAIAASATLPPAEFAEKVDAEVLQLPDGRPRLFARNAAPAIKPLRVPTAVLETHWAMLKTAADVVAKGPDAVKASHDPFGDGPFTYRPLPGGFELTSKLIARGKPVTLIVGPPVEPVG